MLPPINDPAAWRNLVESAQVMGGFATTAGVLIAVVSAALILLQVWSSARAARATLALETHREYIRLCIDRPELCCTRTMLAHLGRKSFDGVNDWPTTKEVEQCLWFLSYVLHTMEQILETTSFLWFRNEAWHAVVRSQLSYHRGLLEQVWPTSRKHYGSRLGAVVEEILSDRTD